MKPSFDDMLAAFYMRTDARLTDAQYSKARFMHENWSGGVILGGLDRDGDLYVHTFSDMENRITFDECQLAGNFPASFKYRAMLVCILQDGSSHS